MVNDVNMFINNTKSYFTLHFHLSQSMTCEDAYEQVEDEYVKVFKKRKYKDYDSFRKAKSIYYAKNRD